MGFVENPVRLPGVTLIMGAELTATDTLVVAVFQLAESVGVKVTDCVEFPTAGAVALFVNAKVPLTLATPPVRTEEARV